MLPNVGETKMVQALSHCGHAPLPCYYPASLSIPPPLTPSPSPSPPRP